MNVKRIVMLKVWGILGWLIVIGLVIYMMFRYQEEPARLVLGETKQDVVLKPLPVSVISDNPTLLLDTANKYLTEPGWIRLSNENIYAGLVDRVWHVSYKIEGRKNFISVHVGSGVGVSYLRSFGKYHIGAAAFYKSGFELYGSAVYSW